MKSDRRLDIGIAVVGIVRELRERGHGISIHQVEPYALTKIGRKGVDIGGQGEQIRSKRLAESKKLTFVNTISIQSPRSVLLSMSLDIKRGLLAGYLC